MARAQLLRFVVSLINLNDSVSFSKYVKAKVRMGIKYYVILRFSVSKPRLFIGLGILIGLQSELVP